MATKLFLSCLLHALLGYAPTYHNSLLNPLEPVVKKFISLSLYRYTSDQKRIDALVPWLWGLLNATTTLASIFFSLLLKPMAENLGRKASCCVIQPLLLICGSLCLATATQTDRFELLFLGQALVGMAYTLTTFSLIYVAECSPLEYRAVAPSLVYMGSPIWLCLGTAMGLPHALGNRHSWQYAFALPAIPALVYLVVAVVLLKESPKYLRTTKGLCSEAREAIRFYHGEQVDVEAVLNEFDREAELDCTCESLSCAEVWQSKPHKWSLIVMTVVGIANQAGASNIVRSYSTEILRLTMNFEDETAAFTSSLLISWPTVMACAFGLALAWLMPRRWHFLGAILLADLGMVIMFLALRGENKHSRNTVLGLMGMCLSSWSYFAGLGSVGGFLAAEMCSQHTRSLASSLRFLATSITAVIQLQLYPVLSESVGAWAFVICSVQDVLCFGFLWIFLPETKGKTVDQVLEKWRQPLEEMPLREFFTFASER